MTSKMPTSNHGRFLHLLFLTLLILMCFNNISTLGHNSLITPETPTLNESIIHPNINILVLSVANDLSPGGVTTLHFVSTFKPKFDLQPGKPFIMFTNFEVKECTLIWETSPPKCAKFNLYDPNVEGSHQEIYWSASDSGIFHSWDEQNWEKRVDWVSC
ncbi:hypothetical protein S83_066213 [Arachis hypogaea]|uniref:S-protein homolog n=1 Tax=Arachis hypogaea TaxID=3818 RepID=A0A6B9VAT1_ARAHY|nr:uncharacterized protein DS421_19g651820 [Arachis hypogaea]